MRAGTVVATLEGRARALVSRRTRRAQFPADAVRHRHASPPTTSPPCAARGAQILDTRKTIPGLRLAQKYAVRVGGGVNHRIGLFDAVMLKENHIRAAGSLDRGDPQRARGAHPALPLIVEVETLDAAATKRCATGCTRILIDDFDADTRREAVRIARPGASRWKSPAASTWTPCARSPKTAWTAFRSAA